MDNSKEYLEEKEKIEKVIKESKKLAKWLNESDFPKERSLQFMDFLLLDLNLNINDHLEILSNLKCSITEFHQYMNNKMEIEIRKLRRKK